MSKLRKVVNRMRSGEDIGLDRTGQKGRQRTINSDGSYNMERKTGKLFGNFNPYHWIITTPWKHYWMVVIGYYTIMNVFFATGYFLIGTDQLGGIRGDDALHQWFYCFFFSAQSFTTVGYGGIHPIGEAANLLAVTEAFFGLLTFALATGTLYGRFSKPVSKIKYSENVIFAPFKGGIGMQFMVANELNSALMEMEARVNISWNEEDENGMPIRRFQQVNLEIDKIAMFPTSWIINHPLDEESALFEKSLDEMKTMDFEIFVLLKGFDDVFSQTIYSRHSYTSESFIWGAKFQRPFHINEQGKVMMDLTKVGRYDLVSLD